MITTSEKLKVILEYYNHDITWLSKQWGISQPAMSKKFKNNNWKESDIKKFCEILNCKYHITFDYDGGTV